MKFSYHPYNNNQWRSTSHGTNEGTIKKGTSSICDTVALQHIKKIIKKVITKANIYIYIYKSAFRVTYSFLLQCPNVSLILPALADVCTQLYAFFRPRRL